MLKDDRNEGAGMNQSAALHDHLLAELENKPYKQNRWKKRITGV
ncbi:hypothetical protein ACFTAO_31225 [Paenibacillus rhizoplanae]